MSQEKLPDEISPARKALLELRLRQKAAKAQQDSGIPRRADPQSARLSFAQERLWFLDQILPERAVFNVPRAIRFDGPVDREALQRALDALVARHESLRTRYRLVGGTPRQFIEEPQPVVVEEHDLRALPAAAREDRLAELLLAGRRREIDLATEQLLRAAWIRCSDEQSCLMLLTHHIASDGWSKGILFRELTSLYRAFQAGLPSPLTDLPIQYADFAEWQRGSGQQELLDRQLTYWRGQLAGIPPLLELPTDFARPSVASYHGSRCQKVLPAGLLPALVRLGQKQGATLLMTLLASFKVLLRRCTGQTDLVVGTPVTGRKHLQTEGLIGDFVNVLVMRTDASGNPSFNELLRRTRETALAAYDQSDIPFELLVADLVTDRNQSVPPLFQTLFTYEQEPAAVLDFPGARATPLEVPADTAKYDVTLAITEGAQESRCTIEYATELFSPGTIERMLDLYLNLLQAIVATPDRGILDLPLLTADDERRLIVDWNKTEFDFPAERCLQELFEERVVQNPTAVALVYEDTTLTFGELNARANQLAQFLVAQGVGPESIVGIGLERGPEMVISLLATLKAGGAYLPLDPGYPADRLAFVLADSQARVLLTTSALQNEWPSSGARLICVDTLAGQSAGADPGNLPVRQTPDNLAYVIYTSGSTGKPKGVQIAHRALINFLYSMREAPGLAAHDSWLAVTSLSFDIAGLEIHLPLLVGARLEIVSRETAADGVQLGRRLAAARPTVMQATPATWRMLMDAGWQGTGALKALCGGEALSPDLARRLLDAGVDLWNMYGPTETTIWSLLQHVPSTGEPITIGRPLVNTQAYVLGPRGEIVPIGIAGELHLGGTGLARGYLNRASLTAEKFIPDRFSGVPGARLYRTGDLVRYREDGQLEFLGRADQQVKVRGFRIELGEIETALSQHPAVREAVVIVREDQPGDQRLVAYLVLHGPDELPVAEIRPFLQQTLPEYMIPSRFVRLAAMPLTPNGKVDRRALPAPADSPDAPGREYVAPRTPVEETLAAIWSTALGVPQVGATDNFFELGGHSLLGTQVVARIRDAFQMDLPFRSLFDAPNLESLGAEIEQLLLQESPDDIALLLAELENSPEGP